MTNKRLLIIEQLVFRAYKQTLTDADFTDLSTEELELLSRRLREEVRHAHETKP